MAPVAVFGRPTLPQTTRTRPAQFRCVGCALLRRLRSIRPAHPTHRFSCRALPPAAQPTHHLPGASGRSPTIPPQQVLTPAHPAARFPMVSQPPHRHPPAPPPGRAGPEKAPRRPSAPPVSVAGRRPKKACHPPLKFAFRPRRQKQGPLRGGFHWGAPQTPRHHAPANARSSSLASAASRWSAAPPSQGRLRRVSIGGLRPPPNPQAKAFSFFSQVPGRGQRGRLAWAQSRGSSSTLRPRRRAAFSVLSVPLLRPSHTTSTSAARFTISALRTWVAAVGPWVA